MSNDNKGKNCGSCIRGSEPMTEPKCVICAEVENKEGVKFSQWESKELPGWAKK